MIGATLKAIRKELGFQTARSFFQEHLNKKAQLDFNYSYYMKIEGNRALPSSTVIATIAGTLAIDDQRLLIMAYCRILFPAQAKLFDGTTAARSARDQRFNLTKPATPQPTLIKQRHLNEAQVAVITQSREHYFLFLILTLARTPVAIPDIKARLPSAAIECLLQELESSQLVLIEHGFANCIAKEMKFPQPETDGLRTMYAAIDQWNAEFAKTLGFDEALEKMMIRRVSGRYLGLLNSQAQLLFDSLRAFDEIDAACNDDVVLLNFSLARGSLPG